jgi:cytochrome c553
MTMNLARTLIVFSLIAAQDSALADAKAGEKKAQLCLLCHKPANGSVPVLEGQPAKYLVAATTAYKTGKRTDSARQMQPNVATLSARDIADIAGYFATRPLVVGDLAINAQTIANGERRVQDLNCRTCHGAALSGNELVPRLAGQSPGYLVKQLEAFAAARRTHPAAEMPSGQAEIEAVSDYLASLK